jgi:intermembrane space import and assembly protein 40
MQNCFRQYPEIYGSEIDKDDAADDDDDDDVDDADFPTAPATTTTASAASASAANPQQASSTPHSAEKVAENRRELGLVPENYRPESQTKADATKHEDSLVPKAAHDGRE